MSSEIREEMWKVLVHLVVRDDDTITADEAIDQILAKLRSQIEQMENPSLENTPYDWRAGYNQCKQDFLSKL